MKTRNYHGRTIFACSQYGIGRCDGKGWHIQVLHLTGLPWAEEYCGQYATLRDAREAVDGLNRLDALLTDAAVSQ